MSTANAPISSRNEILDLLRGYFLIGIFVNHINIRPSIYEYFNGWGNLWVSAAEGFVFISGVVLGIVYCKIINKKGIKFATKKLLTRAVKLYLITTLLTIIYSYWGLKAGTWPHLGYGILYDNIGEVIKNAALFKYSYGWADILIMYTVFVALSPIVLYMLKKGYWKFTLFASFLIWAQNLRDFPNLRESVSYFPLESWQFLFVIAIFIGYHRDSFTSLYRKFIGKQGVVISLALLFSSTLYLSIQDAYYSTFSGQTKDIIDMAFDKLHLGPGRIAAFFIWFIFIYFVFSHFYLYIQKYLGWILLKFGRNALTNYVLQSVILFGTFYIPLGGNYWINTLHTTLALVVLWIVTFIFVKVASIKPGDKTNRITKYLHSKAAFQTTEALK
jgi:hypothetical protein